MSSTSTSTLTTKSALAIPPSIIPLKASLSPSSAPSSPSTTSTAATLRSLYPRAANAFLQRDFALTQSLITSAFSILHPPGSQPFDSLDAFRRKWDLLRITLETTVYASPPPSGLDLEVLPPSLRGNLLLSPHALVTALHTRSLRLFTPTSPPQKSNPAFLPSQILVTLVLSSLKLECPVLGRGMIEEWLAKRGQVDVSQVEAGNGYEKVLEIYCLHVLTRLEEWDYVRDFLQYETELPKDTRERMLDSLHRIRAQASMASRRSTPSTPSLKSKSIPPPYSRPATPSRSASPTPSTSSTSSLSTTSTHTVVPQTPRARPTKVAALTQAMSSTASLSSMAPVSQLRKRSPGRRSQKAGSSKSSHADEAAAPRPLSSLSSRPPFGPLTSAHHHQSHPPSSVTAQTHVITLIKDYVLQYLTSSRLTTFIVLFVILPALSLTFRIRGRNRPGLGRMSNGSGGAADRVRQRLTGGGPSGPGLLKTVLTEMIKAVSDTVRMGGRGLV